MTATVAHGVSLVTMTALGEAVDGPYARYPVYDGTFDDISDGVFYRLETAAPGQRRLELRIRRLRLPWWACDSSMMRNPRTS